MRGIGRGLGSYTLGDQYISPQRRLSQMLTQQGSKGGPSGSWQESLGRIAQQLSGAYIGMQDQKQLDAYLDTIGKTEPDSYSMQPTTNDQQTMESDSVQNILRQNTDEERMENPMIQRNVKAIGYEQEALSQDKARLNSLDPNNFMTPDAYNTEVKTLKDAIGRANQNIENYGDEFNQTMGRLKSQEPTDDQRVEAVRRELLGQRKAGEVNTINEKKPQLDFMIKNLQAMPNNTYAKRGLAQALMLRMDQDHEAGLANKARSQQLEDANINYGRQIDLKQMPLTEEQLQQKQSLLKPAQPKTVNTAEGVFILNSDGTLGERLGSPHSQFGYNQPQAPATPPPSQVGGIPTSNGPWDGMHPKEQPKMQRDIYKESFKMLEKNRAELANSKTMGESLKRFKYLNSIQDTGSFADRITDFSIDDEKREMVKITNLLTPQMRQGMPGAASDRDVAMFRGATVGIDAPKEINDNVIAGMMARLENANNRQSFMEDYFSTNKHLDGAEGKWKEYLEANPIFDPDPAKEGQYALNKNRQGYKQYFSSGKKNRRSTDTPDTPAPPSGFIRD